MDEQAPPILAGLEQAAEALVEAVQAVEAVPAPPPPAPNPLAEIVHAYEESHAHYTPWTVNGVNTMERTACACFLCARARDLLAAT